MNLENQFGSAFTYYHRIIYIFSHLFFLPQLWDINMDSGPVATFQVHEHLRPRVIFLSWCLSMLYDVEEADIMYYIHRNLSVLYLGQLCDLYENDSIFDKFECCLSGDGLRVATGSYRSAYISRRLGWNNLLIQLKPWKIVLYRYSCDCSVSCYSSNLFRVFGCSEGSTEATTLEASKNPMR